MIGKLELERRKGDNTEMIKVTHLKQSVYDEHEQNKKTILNDITTQFEQGEFVGLIGASGSGKSTFLRSIALQLKWDAGDLQWDAKKVISGGGKASRKYRSQAAYLEQNPSLNKDKTALKNVLIGQAGQTSWLRRLTGMIRSDDYMGAMDELEKFGLLDKAHLKAGVLSGGELQRVAICRALVHGATFMAADEPVLGLDPKTAEKVILTLKKLCEEQNKIIVTALPIDLAQRYCHRLIGIADGTITFDVAGRRLTAEEKRSVHLL